MARQSHDYKAQIPLFRRFVPPPLLFFATRFHLVPFSLFSFAVSLSLSPSLPFSLLFASFSSLIALSHLYARSISFSPSPSLSLSCLVASPFPSIGSSSPSRSDIVPALSAGYFIIQLLSFAWQKAPLPTTYRTNGEENGEEASGRAKDGRVTHLISSPSTKSGTVRSPLLSVFDVAEDAKRRERDENTSWRARETTTTTVTTAKGKHGKKTATFPSAPAAFPRPREESVAVANPQRRGSRG